MDKRWMKVAAMLIVLPVFLFCILSACSRNPLPYTGPTTPIRIGVQDNTACSLIWIAKAEGYFEKNGLDPEIVRYPSGKLALQGMLNGEVDYTASADMPLALQGFETNEIRIITTIAQNNNAAWLIARRDAGIQSPADLRNKQIGTQKNSAVHYFLSQFLIHHQIATNEVQIVFLPATALPAALAQGEIDAFCMRNPFINQAKELLGDQAIEFFCEGIYLNTMNLTILKSRLTTRKTETENLLRALLEAESLCILNEKQAQASALSAMGPDRREEMETDWPFFTFQIGLSQYLLLTLEEEARWAQESGFAPTNRQPNYLTMIAAEFLAELSPDHITLVGYPEQ